MSGHYNKTILMLFVPDSILEARRQLLLDIANGKIDAEKAYRQALKLDPEDSAAMQFLGQSRMNAGQREEAEELFWRAIQVQPCAWMPYLQLSRLPDQDPLSKGLAELACRKVLLDPEALQEMADETSPFFQNLEGKGLEILEGLSVKERFEMLAAGLGSHRDLEPLAVTARLRSLRLVHQVQEAEYLEAAQIDVIVQEGESIVPLMVGVLRGWAQDIVPEDDVWVAAHSLALLGEIGEASAIPYLLEMATLEDAEVSGPCGWALDRIIEQHPDQAVKVFGEAAPKLGAGERIDIAGRLIRHPRMVVTGSLFERLFENLDLMDAEDREDCFQALMSTAIMVLGRAGLEFSRKMLRRHGGLLSKGCRRECDAMIEDFGSFAIPPRPPADPSPWTVYDICSGIVDWGAEAVKEEEEEEDEDDLIPPEPVRRKFTPGRNDPCWCGSGKKYKKCHLDADEASERDASKRDEPGPRTKSPQKPAGEFDDLRRKIGEFMNKSTPKREHSVAIEEFFGSDTFDEKLGPMILVDWIIHDRISQAFGRTVLEEYMNRNASSLTDRERQFLESSARSYVDLFEVREVKEGSGMEVISLTSGEVSFVHEISMSKVANRWDGLYARMVHGERGLEFSGTGIRVPRMHLASVQQWMEEDKRRTGLSWPVYLKRNWPRIRAQQAQIAEQWLDELRLGNTDGEELVASSAFYKVLDRGALLASLRSSAKISENEKGTSFTWLTGEEKGTVLGYMRVVGGQLELECNSKERLQRGKRMLADLAGKALQFEKEEFTTLQDINRNNRENPSPPRSGSRKDEIPPEVKREFERQYMEDHYAKWVDMKLPALEGKTPRQAVKNAAGKRKVAELLKQLENTESEKRRAGEYAYDVSKLRTELGIKG